MATMFMAITAAANNGHTTKSGAQVDYTTHDADIATLVADGATPTEAHVTAADASWTTLKAQLVSQAADVSIIINNTNVTRNRLREILRLIEDRVINGSSFLTS